MAVTETPAPGRQRRARLTIIAGEPIGQCYPLTATITRIGRNPTNTITLPDRHISGYHVRIEHMQDGRYIMTDSGSANGTILNGQPCGWFVALQPDDVLQVGLTALRFDDAAA